MVDASASEWAKEVRRVAVIGAGTMGEGIAQGFAEAGISVTLCDISQDQLETRIGMIARNVAQARENGIEVDTPDIVCGRIAAVETNDPVSVVSDCALVVETVPELIDLKRALFRSLDGLDRSILIASNTSSMTIDSIAGDMDSGARALGVHYFNPAHLIPAVELHKGSATSDATIEKLRALMVRIGKVPFLVAKSIPGLVINRLTGALSREVSHLIEEEVISPRDLDAGVMASIGFRMAWVGPLQGSDFIGLDTGVRVTAALAPTLSNRTGPAPTVLQKVARGELGVKSGKGWYDYGPGDAEAITQARNLRLIRQLKLFREMSDR